jgi:hypothetical protein
MRARVVAVQLALDFFFPTLLEAQGKSLIESLISLSQHIRGWMEKATQHFPSPFTVKKLHEVKRFALNLRKRSRINLLAQQVPFPPPTSLSTSQLTSCVLTPPLPNPFSPPGQRKSGLEHHVGGLGGH